MRRLNLIVLVCLAIRLALPACGQQTLQYPPTPKKPVTDEYHGVRVIDNYRWLEDANDPAVRQWVGEQNKLSRSVLENIPARANIASRLNSLYNDRPTIYYNFSQRGMFFAMKLQPG